MIIIIDIIVLSIDNYPLSKKYTYIIETIDFTIFLLFCVELLLKSLSYGIKIYFKNPFNCLNFILILMNSIQYIYETTLVWDYYSFEAFALKTTPSAAFIKPAKAFRVFEVMYYSRFFASFSILFKAFIYSLTKMKFFLINTVFLILMLGLIGKELFAYKVRVESTHHWKLSDDLYFFFQYFFSYSIFSKTGNKLVVNYDTNGEAVTAVILALYNEEWHLPMYYLYMDL